MSKLLVEGVCDVNWHALCVVKVVTYKRIQHARNRAKVDAGGRIVRWFMRKFGVLGAGTWFCACTR
jgi:hypothetical protein